MAPFAIPGRDRDVKFYDRGALAKFADGAVTAVIYGPDGKQDEALVTSLWAGETAAPEDLLKQMDDPLQYLNESQMWEIEELVLPLSENLVMVSPILKRLPDRMVQAIQDQN